MADPRYPMYNEVRKALDAINFSYTAVPDRFVYKFKVRNEWCIVDTGENGKSVGVYYILTEKINVDKRAAVAKKLCEMNYGLQLGIWEMDYDDGELRFRISYGVREANVAATQSVVEFIKAAIHVGYRTFSEGLRIIGQISGNAPAAAAAAADQDSDDPPLLIAVRNGDFDEVRRQVLERGANVNQGNKRGSTPLIAAAFRGNTAIAEFLLEAGANVNQENQGQDTPLSLAIWKGFSETARLFLQHGAQYNHVDRFGDTPLIDAAKRGLTDVVAALVALGADVNHRNNDNKSALDWALANKHEPVAKILLQNGARPSVPVPNR